MSPDAEKTLLQLLRVQQEQYRYQTVKTSFASDLIFKVLPFVALFAFFAMILDSCGGGAK